MILNRAEMKLALRDTVNDSLDETVYALYAALQAWAKWFHTPNNLIDLTLLQIAADLTEAAGIDWPQEGEK